MKNIVSERLFAARKRKALTQKEAASQLGISQALLSHYEKGIRDCNPAFLANAAVYYDVSADYLLGLSDKPRDTDAVFSDAELPLDGEPSAQTVYRALVMFAKEAEKISPACGKQTLAAYALCLYKLLAALPADISPVKVGNDADFLANIAEATCLQALTRLFSKENAAPQLPLCVKTAAEQAEKQMRASVAALDNRLDALL